MLDVVAGKDAVQVAVGRQPLVHLVVAESLRGERVQAQQKARRHQCAERQRGRDPPGRDPAAQFCFCGMHRKRAFYNRSPRPASCSGDWRILGHPLSCGVSVLRTLVIVAALLVAAGTAAEEPRPLTPVPIDVHSFRVTNRAGR